MAYIPTIVPFLRDESHSTPLTEHERSFQNVIALREHDTLPYAWASFCCQSMEDAEELKAKLGGNWRIIDNRGRNK